MSSTYQPSTPVQPSCPVSNCSWNESPDLIPSVLRLICDVPQVPPTSPPSVPLKPGCPASGLVLPATLVLSVLLYGLKVYAAAGTTWRGPRLMLIFTLPPSQPVSV